MKFATKLIHNSSSKDPHTGAVSVPIYQVSTFHQENIEAMGEYDYSRSGNPTRKSLEGTIAELEGGSAGFAFASGMAAITSVLLTFSKGDHILVGKDIYGGTYRACTSILKDHGVEVTFVDAQDLQDIEKNIQNNTKGLYLETPSNPLLKVTDLKGAIALAKKHNLIVMVDNTFLSPYLQRPLELGVDIVMHSATKFIGGHSDVVGGLVVVKDSSLANKIYKLQNTIGAILGPQDSWLLLRGLKTLKVRMDYQQKSAMKLAEWLLNHESVAEVFYLGLQHHEGRDIHFSQASGPGAVLSFKMKSVELTKAFLKAIRLPAVAVSLGGIETIVSYPVLMSHASIPKEEREKLGITEELIRVSLGLEDVEDLIADFNQAMEVRI
ncbi:cystathionine beta-lyase [Anaerovirgula multivorans]|uniref:cysteine-S-conjugate beta-lyase n=1 Tax=Anaerovirgula multivorans TaxID=312168 RepID=A0A239BEW9_9FIRM|nr:aminotransferase class I/II-fold pyridoxal phosphate-dependent enzyme [Anaerovirgula multivorans]SNS06279.1 cystathionine beta-lyase [Anaerovirgula multivorans]